jgi:hypothetical protein
MTPEMTRTSISSNSLVVFLRLSGFKQNRGFASTKAKQKGDVRVRFVKTHTNKTKVITIFVHEDGPAGDLHVVLGTMTSRYI